jgi:hypothetical protein
MGERNGERNVCVEKGNFRGMFAENGIDCLELETP